MAANIHKNSRLEIEQTTVRVSKLMQGRMRDAADNRGMKMFDFVEQLAIEAMEAMEEGQITIPRKNGTVGTHNGSGFGGKVRKSVSK